MKRLLLPLLAALALPTAVYATNFVECDALYNAYDRISKKFLEADKNRTDSMLNPENYELFPEIKQIYAEDRKSQKKRLDKIIAIAKKRGCLWTF